MKVVQKDIMVLERIQPNKTWKKRSLDEDSFVLMLFWTNCAKNVVRVFNLENLCLVLELASR